MNAKFTSLLAVGTIVVAHCSTVERYLGDTKCFLLNITVSCAKCFLCYKWATRNIQTILQNNVQSFRFYPVSKTRWCP